MLLEKYAIGIDIGTTSTKAVLFDERGRALTSHSVSYPLLALEPGAAEQNPDEIYDAVTDCLKETVKKGSVEGLHFISFSTAMHSLIAVDSSGTPLTNSITWADTRSEPFAMEMRNESKAGELYKRTGVPLHPMTPFFKLMWLKNESPEIFQRTAMFAGIKDYILFRWFGEWVTDFASAAAMGMWNLHNLTWDEEALSLADVKPERLPVLKPTTFYWEQLPEKIAADCGIKGKVKVVIGATDGPLSNLGVGAISSGDVAVTIGTSGAIRTVSDQPVLDESGRTFSYPLTEKHWISGGPVNNGGLAFQWVHDLLEQEGAGFERADSYEELSLLAKKAPAGSEGLVFLPHLTGERAPLWEPRAKGSFIGLTLRHKKEHFVRAVLEGTILHLYRVYQLVNNQADQQGMVKIFATGGFTQSRLWTQIMADIFQEKVYIPANTESSCLGAVLLGHFAVGGTNVLREVEEAQKDYETVSPDPEKKEVYQDLFLLFKTLSQSLMEDYRLIHDFQNKYK
jgi:gluconokinase